MREACYSEYRAYCGLNALEEGLRRDGAKGSTAG